MKAIAKLKSEPGLWMTDVPVPTPDAGEVLIRIQKTAICGTDLHIYEWNDWAKHTIPVPLVVGHEFVGEIAGFGAGVQGFSVGERVSGEGHLVCGHCRNCLAGRRHLCIHTKGVGVNRPGAYAEYLCIPAINVWRLDKRISLEQASYFDPLGNAVHTALTYDLVGEDVLITGAGPIGLMAIVICKSVGARRVVITDVNPFRLDLAKKMGATRAVNVRNEKLADVMTELGFLEGFDVGLEMSGNQAALNDMLRCVRHGGQIALLGLQPSDASVDLEDVIFKSLTIQGIYGRKMFETWYKMQSLLLGGMDTSAVVTHRFKVDEFEKGFEAMKSGNCGKVILDWE
ncbi:MAG: L-threonine 3-dehydrogenase [Planctomycetota bacterium]